MAASRARPAAPARRRAAAPLLALGSLGALGGLSGAGSAPSARRSGRTAFTHRPVQRLPTQRVRWPRWRGRPRAALPATEAPSQAGASRQAWVVWAGAAVQFLASMVTATLVGAPYTYEGESRKRVGPRWLWSFWVRLPLVLYIAYGSFPWLCRTACQYFPASESFNQVITCLFSPMVSLIYAIIAGQVIVSLWSRLYSVRTLLKRELALLELLQRKLPEGDAQAQELFAKHLAGIDKYAIEQGTIAPSSYNKLMDLSCLPSLKDDSVVQDLLDSLAEIRAERRATTGISYPRSLWGTLRVCSLVLLGCFVILAQDFGYKSFAEQRGIRIVFCAFCMTVFWVNHICRDLAELNYGEFQIDADDLRQNNSFGLRQGQAPHRPGRQ